MPGGTSKGQALLLEDRRLETVSDTRCAMPDETHKLQKDPPEGSRETIDHELQRQQKNKPSDAAKDQSQGAPSQKAG